MIDTKRYLLAFFITVALFASGFFTSTFFSNKKLEEVKRVQDTIAIDILSNETQFDLLREVSCTNLSSSVLSNELNDIGEKLTYTQSLEKKESDDVAYLRKYYALLQVKDYLLSKRLGEKCTSKKPVFIMYFYTSKETCDECTKMSSTLSALKRKYPDLRIYSFDYYLPVSTVDTIKKIYQVPEVFPSLVIEEKLYTSMLSFEEIDELLPEAFKATATSTVATSTSATTTKGKTK